MFPSFLSVVMALLPTTTVIATVCMQCNYCCCCWCCYCYILCLVTSLFRSILLWVPAALTHNEHSLLALLGRALCCCCLLKGRWRKQLRNKILFLVELFFIMRYYCYCWRSFWLHCTCIYSVSVSYCNVL